MLLPTCHTPVKEVPLIHPVEVEAEATNHLVLESIQTRVLIEVARILTMTLDLVIGELTHDSRGNENKVPHVLILHTRML